MKRIFNGSGGRKAALILSLCLIFALAAGGTLAYLKAHTPPVTNTFTAAKSDIKIDENVENGEKSSIRVRNTGTAAAYVRVKLVMNWVDESGRVVTGALPEVSIVRDGSWITGSDGIYYCTKPVAPKDAEPDNVTSRRLPPGGDGSGREHSGCAEHGRGGRVASGQGRGRQPDSGNAIRRAAV